MSDKENEEERCVNLICRQTDYCEEDARRLLRENNNDPMIVIKKYMGVYKEEKEGVVDAKSRNQEIFKQFRKKLHIEKLPNA
jgi:hypothetical protein